MKVLTLTNGITIECFDDAEELRFQITNDLQNFKEWFSSILFIRNGRFEKLWVRKGTSNKFLIYDLEKRWSGLPRKTLSITFKINSIHYQETSGDLEDLPLSNLVPELANPLFQIRKGDLGIYLLFNPLYGTMRILTSFEEIQDDRQPFLEKDMDVISQIFTILSEIHGSINMFSPHGVAA